MFDVQTQNLEPGTPNLVLCREADFLEAAGAEFYVTVRITPFPETRPDTQAPYFQQLMRFIYNNHSSFTWRTTYHGRRINGAPAEIPRTPGVSLTPIAFLNAGRSWKNKQPIPRCGINPTGPGNSLSSSPKSRLPSNRSPA
jgi:hypothetical protein